MTFQEFFVEVDRISDYTPQRLWIERGPRHTRITQHAVYTVNGQTFYVQNYEGGGFQIFFPDRGNTVNGTISRVLKEVGA